MAGPPICGMGNAVQYQPFLKHYFTTNFTLPLTPPSKKKKKEKYLGQDLTGFYIEFTLFPSVYPFASLQDLDSCAYQQ